MTCQIGSLAADEVFSAEILIGTKGGSALTVDASATATEADPEAENNSDAVTVGVCRRDCPIAGGGMEGMAVLLVIPSIARRLRRVAVQP